ncbi:MAG: hypothetical protein JNL66_18535, partial [Alphaproteobacteria bacterium]|nr:hypothetical protein [Alphaproteobacteria bacterium]
MDGEVVRAALAPGVSGAFANALRQPARPRAFNASAVPIPVPGPLGALIAALTLMMILIEEQRRRNRPLPAEPPPDEPANEDQEQERLQEPPAPPPVPPQRRPPQRSPELPPLSGEEGRRAEPPTPFTEPERDGSRLHAEVRRILRRFPEARRDLIRREFINTERL